MKRVVLFGCMAILGMTASAGDFCWNWWVGGDDRVRDLNGCQLGIASECYSIRGAQVSLLWNRTKKVRGGCQVALGYNDAIRVHNGPQVALVNVATDGAALQFGLLNFNAKGFLPFFPLFNFGTSMFGGTRK